MYFDEPDTRNDLHRWKEKSYKVREASPRMDAL
jgi:hypothetical protein